MAPSALIQGPNQGLFPYRLLLAGAHPPFSDINVIKVLFAVCMPGASGSLACAELASLS